MDQYVVPVKESLQTFEEKIERVSGLQMVYARLNVQPNRLFDDVILDGFIRAPGDIPPLKAQGMIALRRAIFRGSASDDYGKELRYTAETQLQPYLIGKTFSRNQLLNEGVEIFENRTKDTTDILHEYFIPRDHATRFVNEIRPVIQKRKPNLLNVTVRIMNEDHDTFLRYADHAMISFFMLFVQEKTADAEKEMQDLTRELIDAALKHSGRYYLPYRLHATQEQFEKAYPMAKRFFELKRKYDPEEIFQNYFYLEYAKSR